MNANYASSFRNAPEKKLLERCSQLETRRYQTRPQRFLKRVIASSHLKPVTLKVNFQRCGKKKAFYMHFKKRKTIQLTKQYNTIQLKRIPLLKRRCSKQLYQFMQKHQRITEFISRKQICRTFFTLIDTSKRSNCVCLIYCFNCKMYF